MGWQHSYESGWKNNTNALAVALRPYMPSLPVDPINQSTPAYSGGQTYSYYASSYGRSGKWYMLVIRLENRNNALDLQDGSRACDGTFFDYGGNDGYIITYGGNCTLP